MALIYTTKGMLEEDGLVKTTGVLDNDNEHTEWTEWRQGDELVKRSVHVHLKQAGIACVPEINSFGG